MDYRYYRAEALLTYIRQRALKPTGQGQAQRAKRAKRSELQLSRHTPYNAEMPTLRPRKREFPEHDGGIIGPRITFLWGFLGKILTRGWSQNNNKRVGLTGRELYAPQVTFMVVCGSMGRELYAPQATFTVVCGSMDRSFMLPW
jgi:hypothetical protein